MKTHDQFADDLALYALDELTGSDRQELEGHLETCAACRRELQALRGDLGLLGLSSSGPQPPARSKDRLMRAIAAEPRGVSFRQRPAPRRACGGRGCRRWLRWCLLFALAGLWRSNGRMKDQLAELGGHNQDQTTQLDRLNQELWLLTAPDAVHVSLNPQKAPKQPSGTAIFSPSRKRMMFMASNLAPVPEGKAYELWIIPAQGRAHGRRSLQARRARQRRDDGPPRCPRASKPRPSPSPWRTKKAPTSRRRRSC